MIIKYKTNQYEIGYRKLRDKVLKSEYDYGARAGVRLKVIPRSWLKKIVDNKEPVIGFEGKKAMLRVWKEAQSKKDYQLNLNL